MNTLTTIVQNKIPYKIGALSKGELARLCEEITVIRKELDYLSSTKEQLESIVFKFEHVLEENIAIPQYIKNITYQDILKWNRKSEFSGDYKELINQPTKVSDFINDLKYVTQTQLSKIVSDVNGKTDQQYVKKVEGKDLSSNDFTDAYRFKLESLKYYDDSKINELIQGQIYNKINVQYITGLSPVATSGSYKDLKDVPDIIPSEILSEYATVSQINTLKEELGCEFKLADEILTIKTSSGTFTLNTKGSEGPKGDKGDPGEKGSQGKSAYDIAVDNGFVGTVQEWLQSLKASNISSDSLPQGTNGKSAYELAIDNGFVGTLTEWLDSLKGTPGSDGYTPIKGVDYFDGNQGLQGDQGNGIKNVVIFKTDSTNICEFELDNGEKHRLEIADGIKGQDGIGINSVNILETSESGGVNQVQFTLDNERSYNLTVKNGIDGEAGPKGDKGDKGEKGDTGAAIFRVLTQQQYDSLDYIDPEIFYYITEEADEIDNTSWTFGSKLPITFGSNNSKFTFGSKFPIIFGKSTTSFKFGEAFPIKFTKDAHYEFGEQFPINF